MLRGRIEWNNDFSDTEYDRVLIIDGTRITIEEFGQMFEQPFVSKGDSIDEQVFFAPHAVCLEALDDTVSISVFESLFCNLSCVAAGL